MDTSQKANENEGDPQRVPLAPRKTNGAFTGDMLEVETWKSFFRLTGGSPIYCLSAVFVAYGIVKVLGPILSSKGPLTDALPCIFTLHGYELALLAVLILIVAKKVVDDAISILVLGALFLIGTSMALGSVADKDLTISLWLGLAGIAVALGKIGLMQRFARIPFRGLSLLGLGLVMTYNYLGPVLLARAVSLDPTHELARRELWLWLCLVMMMAAGLVLIEAMRGTPPARAQETGRAPFIQTPAMVYTFALVVVVASGVHQYSMSFTFALERVLGDYAPVSALPALLLLEVLRHSGKRFGVAEIVTSGVPLAVVMLAIHEKSVLASGRVGLELIWYPPVLLALFGLALVGLAMYHRRYPLLAVACAYGLGVILTAGFSPEHPHDLNVPLAGGILASALVLYGLVKRKPSVCAAGIALFCIGLGSWDPFSKAMTHHHLTNVGGVAGVAGLGTIILYLIFDKNLPKTLRIIGAFCLAGFVYDYLPDHAHYRFLIVLIGTGLLLTALWFRTRDILVVTALCVPFFIRLYMMARYLAHWRFVILGFLLLGAGTMVSLLKHTARGGETRKEKGSKLS